MRLHIDKQPASAQNVRHSILVYDNYPGEVKIEVSAPKLCLIVSFHPHGNESFYEAFPDVATSIAEALHVRRELRRIQTMKSNEDRLTRLRIDEGHEALLRMGLRAIEAPRQKRRRPRKAIELLRLELGELCNDIIAQVQRINSNAAA